MADEQEEGRAQPGEASWAKSLARFPEQCSESLGFLLILSPGVAELQGKHVGSFCLKILFLT